MQTHEVFVDVPFGKPVEMAGVNIQGRRFLLKEPKTLEGGSKAWIKFIGDANGIVVDVVIDRVLPPDYDEWMRQRHALREHNAKETIRRERVAAEKKANAAINKRRGDQSWRLGAAMRIPPVHFEPMAGRVRMGSGR